MKSVVMLVTLSWTSFALKSNYIEARLASTITLVLALMALSQVITPSLPSASTPAHRFMQTSTMFIVMVGIQSIITCKFHPVSNIHHQICVRVLVAICYLPNTENCFLLCSDAFGSENHTQSATLSQAAQQEEIESNTNADGVGSVAKKDNTMIARRRARSRAAAEPVEGNVEDGQNALEAPMERPGSARKVPPKEHCLDYLSFWTTMDFSEMIDAGCTVGFPLFYVLNMTANFPLIPWSHFIFVFPVGFSVALLVSQTMMESTTLYYLPGLRACIPSDEAKQVSQYTSSSLERQEKNSTAFQNPMEPAGETESDEEQEENVDVVIVKKTASMKSMMTTSQL